MMKTSEKIVPVSRAFFRAVFTNPALVQKIQQTVDPLEQEKLDQKLGAFKAVTEKVAATAEGTDELFQQINELAELAANLCTRVVEENEIAQTCLPSAAADQTIGSEYEAAQFPQMASLCRVALGLQ